MNETACRELAHPLQLQFSITGPFEINTGFIRPLHVLRYFPPSWISLIGFSLNRDIEEFPRSVQKLNSDSRHLYAGGRLCNKQVTYCNL